MMMTLFLLYTDDATASNALNSFMGKNFRNKINYSNFSETSKSELQNEIASKMLINQSWTTLTARKNVKMVGNNIKHSRLVQVILVQHF